MMSYTYVLKSQKDKKLYIGSTVDLMKRIKQHNRGYVKSTKNRRPLILIYKESFNNIRQARCREKLFKKSHSILYKAAGWKDIHK